MAVNWNYNWIVMVTPKIKLYSLSFILDVCRNLEIFQIPIIQPLFAIIEMCLLEKALRKET